MCHKFVLLLCLSVCLILASARRPSYNVRFGSLPQHFVGKGAYTLLPSKRQPPIHHKQNHKHQQQQLQEQLQQRQQLFQWATMRKKLA